MINKKLPSLSIFFPFYNDEGTVERQIKQAFEVGSYLTNDLEVVALHGGNSKDETFKKILQMKKKYPKLKVVNKSDNNEGYAVIKYGFKACTKDWIFYTDGDAQYHLEEDLPKLVEKQLKTKADLVNGYKNHRGDNLVRICLGKIYSFISKKIFDLTIRDVDCDFRLVKKNIIASISIESTDSSILLEMIKKLELAEAKIVEIPVGHYQREYGKSNYTAFSLLKEKVTGDFKLFWKIYRLKKNKAIEPTVSEIII